MSSSADSIKDPAGTPGAEKDTAGGATEKPHDLRTILDNSAFREFNGKHGGETDVSKIPPEELQRRYETFENKKMLQEALPALFDEHIKDELGIELGPEGKKALGEFLDSQALAHPEKLKELAERCKEIEAKKKEVQAQDAEIARLGGADKREARLAELKAEEEKIQAQKKFNERHADPLKSKLDKALKFFSHPMMLGAEITAAGILVGGTPAVAAGLLMAMSVGGGMRLFRKAREAGAFGKAIKEKEAKKREFEKMPKKERLAFFEGVDSKLAAIRTEQERLTAEKATLATAERGRDYKAAFGEMRKSFFEGFEGTKTIYAATLAKSWEQAVKAFESGKPSLGDAEKAQAALEKIAAIKDKLPPGVTLEAATAGLPGGFTPERLQELQRNAQSAIEGAARNIVANALQEYKPGAHVVTELEKLLKPLSGKEKLGKMKGEEVQEFVRSEVEKYRDSLVKNIAVIDGKIIGGETVLAETRGRTDVSKEALTLMEEEIKARKNKREEIKCKKLALDSFLAFSKAEADKRIAEAAAAEHERSEEEKRTKELEDLEKDLKAKRDRYIEEYHRPADAKKNGYESMLPGLNAEKRHKEYTDLLEAYAKAFYKNKKAELEKKGLTGEKLEKELQFVRANDIFAKFFVEEQQKLDRKKVEAWPPKEKGLIRKGLEWQAKNIPRWARILVPALVVGGGAFMAPGGGIATAAAAAGFIAFRGAVRMAVFMGVMKGYSELLEKVSPKDARRFQMDQLRMMDSLVEDFAEMKKEYDAICAQAAKEERWKQISKMLVGFGLGGLSFSYGDVINHTIDSIGAEALGRIEATAHVFGIGGAPGAEAAGEAAIGAPVEATPAGEIKLEHGTAEATFNEKGDVVGLRTGTTFVKLDGTEYFSPGAKAILESEVGADIPSETRGLMEAGEDMLRMEGKNLGANIRLYEELQAAGRLKEAAYFKGVIEKQVERLANTRGAGFLDKTKLADFWGRVNEAEMPPAEAAPVEPPPPAPEIASPGAAGETAATPAEEASAGAARAAEAPPPAPGAAAPAEGAPPAPETPAPPETISVAGKEIRIERGADGRIESVNLDQLDAAPLDEMKYLRRGANEFIQQKFGGEQTTTELTELWKNLKGDSKELDKLVSAYSALNEGGEHEAAKFLLPRIQEQVSEIEKAYGAEVLNRGRFPDSVERYLEEQATRLSQEIEATLPKVRGEGTEYLIEDADKKLAAQFEKSPGAEYEAAVRDLNARMRALNDEMTQFGRLKAAGNTAGARALLGHMGEEIKEIEIKYPNIIDRPDLPSYLEEYLKDGKYPEGLEPPAPAPEAAPTADIGTAHGEAAPVAGGRLEAIPAEPVFAGEFAEPTDLKIADWGPKIETQSADVTFGYNADHEPVSVTNTARPNRFLFFRIGERSIEPDPNHFLADDYTKTMADGRGSVEDLTAKSAELDRLVQIKNELSDRMTGKIPRGLARENEFLLRNIRKQLFALEGKYGVGVLDHSKLPSDIRGLIDVPMEGGLNPQYDDFGKVTGFEPNPRLIEAFPDYVLFPKENTQGLVEAWASKSGIGDARAAQLHLVYECKQLAFEINTYKGMEAANFAGRGYGKVMDALLEDMKHRLGEIQKVNVPVIDQSKLPDFLKGQPNIEDLRAPIGVVEPSPPKGAPRFDESVRTRGPEAADVETKREAFARKAEADARSAEARMDERIAELRREAAAAPAEPERPTEPPPAAKPSAAPETAAGRAEADARAARARMDEMLERSRREAPVAPAEPERPTETPSEAKPSAAPESVSGIRNEIELTHNDVKYRAIVIKDADGKIVRVESDYVIRGSSGNKFYAAGYGARAQGKFVSGQLEFIGRKLEGDMVVYEDLTRLGNRDAAASVLKGMKLRIDSIEQRATGIFDKTKLPDYLRN